MQGVVFSNSLPEEGVAFSCSQLLCYWSVTDGDACRYLPEDYEHHMWLRETAYIVDQLGCQGVWKLPQH